MSKALKIIGTVAAVVALVATGVGIAGGGALFAGAGASTAAVAAATATITTVATVASVVSAAAMIGAVALAKPPPARGSVSQIIVSVDPPRPFVMGEGYVGGVIRHDVGYGATVNKVPNPYLWQVHVYSGVGPVQSITPQVDFGSVPSYYSTYLYTTTQLGLCPQSAALTPQWSGAPGWSTSSKLSGCAAIGWSARFDKDGKRFANGLPVFGAYGQWAKAYDPRKDSTRAGGSGSHRVTDPTTWEYTARPALLAGSYAYGYYQNGKLIMGMGLPDAAINWDYVADWANVCDDNSWTLFGRVFEPGGPEARWANLTDICIAGGGTPVFAGGQLSFHYSAPRVALGTITADDLADGTQRVTGQKSYAQRINTVIPRFIDSASNWEQVPAAPVVASTLVAEDGETRSEEYPYNLVKNKNQAAQLAMYRIYNAREITVPEVPLLPNYVGIRPGECWTFDLPDLGLDNQDCIVWSRSIDPGSFGVTLSLETETAAKHAFALGQTGTAPDTPTLARTGEQLDDITDAVMLRTDDIADAALTANWPDVTGTGRPTDYADVTAANTAAAIAGQGDLATSNRATLPFGANLAVNSEFLLVDPTYAGGLYPFGWNAGWTGNSTNLGSVTFNDRRVQLQDVTYAFARDVTGAPNGTAMDCITGYPFSLSLARFAVPVLPGERIVASALIGHQNCTGAYIVIGFSDENHAYVDEYAGSVNAANIGAGAYNTLTRSALALTGHQVTVPADGGGSGTGKRRWAVIWVRFNISGSPTNPRLLVAAPLIAKVPANQTAIPAYSPGPADRQASYGATTGTSLVSPTYGTLSDSGVYTPIGTSAAITGQAATATNSDYTAVTGTKPPADADKTSANTSANTTNVGTVPSTAVQSTINTGGGVANNQVATAAIVANAVNDGANASLATLQTRATAGTVDGLSVAYTSTGGPIRVDICLDAWKSAGSTHTAQVQLIQDVGGTLTQIGRNLDVYGFSGDFTPITYWGLASPGAGSVTYKIRFTRDSGTGTLAWARQAISVQEFKR